MAKLTKVQQEVWEKIKQESLPGYIYRIGHYSFTTSNPEGLVRYVGTGIKIATLKGIAAAGLIEFHVPEFGLLRNRTPFTLTDIGLAEIARAAPEIKLGVQPVPNDPRIFNRTHENGNVPPLAAFFEGHKPMYDHEAIPAAKPETEEIPANLVQDKDAEIARLKTRIKELERATTNMKTDLYDLVMLEGSNDAGEQAQRREILEKYD